MRQDRHDRGPTGAARRRRAGFTIVEMVLVSAIIAIAAAAAFPAWRNVAINNRLRDAGSDVSQALATARARAISSGSNVVVYFNTGVNLGNDICGNPIVDVSGNPVPLMVFDDGPPGNPTANCCRDAGDAILETANAQPDVGWGTNLATASAPNDADPNVNYANGTSFRDPNSNTTEWVLFRPDGVPVGFQDNGGPCDPGTTGTGQGAIYLTNNSRDIAVVMNALGGIRSHHWDRANGAWTN